jgi:HTH-type transcriptional regulator / antitoxin HigA
LEVLVTLVEAYEQKHYRIEPPDPIEAIKFRMEQLELKPADLADILGGRSRVSEILNKKRKLTVEMMRSLRKRLAIPAESLLAWGSVPKFSTKGFWNPLRLTANALAKAPNRITAILKDERGITSRNIFQTSAEFWMNLQTTYDLRNAEKALPARVIKSIEDKRSVLV